MNKFKKRLYNAIVISIMTLIVLFGFLIIYADTCTTLPYYYSIEEVRDNDDFKFINVYYFRYKDTISIDSNLIFEIGNSTAIFKELDFRMRNVAKEYESLNNYNRKHKNYARKRNY